ncbi:hypothetical protein [Nocardioides pinisoli]|uniref:DeoR-like transcriptional repressor C-terminal sensor domain-containing protein n=1 Tax=Nocardioides pinisoli TaxID=2950279 RepID=A0ABT1KSG5_9ACTN|nr:hypothetical protein [Nocardioides pinisoli]MCP3420679.1 hypothetical protein [Nocardioides pinisoli]
MLARAFLKAFGKGREPWAMGSTGALVSIPVFCDSGYVIMNPPRPSHGLVGPLAALALDRMSFDVAFLGADAVDVRRGVGEPTVEETSLKEQVAGIARRTVVLADATKLEAAAPAWTLMPGPWTLVTDETTPDLEAACREAGVALLS